MNRRVLIALIAAVAVLTGAGTFFFLNRADTANSNVALPGQDVDDLTVAIDLATQTDSVTTLRLGHRSVDVEDGTPVEPIKKTRSAQGIAAAVDEQGRVQGTAVLSSDPLLVPQSPTITYETTAVAIAYATPGYIANDPVAARVLTELALTVPSTAPLADSLRQRAQTDPNWHAQTTDAELALAGDIQRETTQAYVDLFFTDSTLEPTTSEPTGPAPAPGSPSTGTPDPVQPGTPAPTRSRALPRFDLRPQDTPPQLEIESVPGLDLLPASQRFSECDKYPVLDVTGEDYDGLCLEFDNRTSSTVDLKAKNTSQRWQVVVAGKRSTPAGFIPGASYKVPSAWSDIAKGGVEVFLGQIGTACNNIGKLLQIGTCTDKTFLAALAKQLVFEEGETALYLTADQAAGPLHTVGFVQYQDPIIDGSVNPQDIGGLSVNRRLAAGLTIADTFILPVFAIAADVKLVRGNARERNDKTEARKSAEARASNGPNTAAPPSAGPSSNPTDNPSSDPTAAASSDPTAEPTPTEDTGPRQCERDNAKLAAAAGKLVNANEATFLNIVANDQGVRSAWTLLKAVLADDDFGPDLVCWGLGHNVDDLINFANGKTDDKLKEAAWKSFGEIVAKHIPTSADPADLIKMLDGTAKLGGDLVSFFAGLYNVTSSAVKSFDVDTYSVHSGPASNDQIAKVDWSKARVSPRDCDSSTSSDPGRLSRAVDLVDGRATLPTRTQVVMSKMQVGKVTGFDKDVLVAVEQCSAGSAASGRQSRATLVVRQYRDGKLVTLATDTLRYGNRFRVPGEVALKDGKLVVTGGEYPPDEPFAGGPSDAFEAEFTLDKDGRLVRGADKTIIPPPSTDAPSAGQPSCADALAILKTNTRSTVELLQQFGSGNVGAPWAKGKSLTFRTLSDGSGDPVLMVYNAGSGLDDATFDLDIEGLQSAEFPDRAIIFLDSSNQLRCSNPS